MKQRGGAGTAAAPGRPLRLHRQRPAWLQRPEGRCGDSARAAVRLLAQATTRLARVVSTRKPASGVASGRNWRLIAVVAVLGVAVAAADQVTKLWATSALAGREPVAVIGDLIQFRVVHNAGAAFSLASGLTWLLTLLVAIVVVVVIRVSARIGSRAWSVALGLLLGGGVGNLIDRLFRAPGFPEGRVVDFIDYGGWFVGNVADIAIVAALILIGVLTARGIQVDGTRRSVPGERSR